MRLLAKLFQAMIRNKAVSEHRTDSFEEAVVLAVNLGDDADTVGAVTGQLAGALYGLGGIPERWLQPIAWGLSEFPCMAGRFATVQAMARVKRSPNSTANCALAMPHSRAGMVHSFSERFNTRDSSFSAASSVGK